MAEGLALGSAFFSFGLGVEGFARGSAQLVSKVASTAGAIFPQAGKIGDSFAKVDEKLGSVMRSTERFSRGLRGISPEVAAAKEQVYRYEDSMKSLQEQIELTKIRIQERTKAEQDNIAQIARSKQAIESYKQSFANLDQQLQANRTILQQMRSGAIPATTDQIKSQERVVRGLESALDTLEQKQRREQRTLASVENSQQRLTLERQRAEHVLTQQQQSESRYGSLLDLAKSRVDKVTQSIKNRYERQQAAKASVDAHAQADQHHIGILDRLFGLFQRDAQAINEVSAASQRAVSIQQGFNNAMTKTSTILRDIAVGAVGSFIGNTLSSLVTGFQSSGGAALSAYKSYETLGMSLKALSARELVAEGRFQKLDLAQEAAGKQSQNLIKWMEQLAIQSPFSVDDISGAFRLGNALGFTSDQMKRLITDTTDWATASGGTGQSIESVIRAMGQMHNTGHVTLEDLNQMTDAGLSARDILRNEFAPEIKASKKSLEDLISDGVLPADRAINAMAVAMEKDFGGAAGKAGNSMTGLLNSLSDLKNAGLRELFTSTFQAIQEPLGRLVTFLQSDQVIGSLRQFGQLIGTGVSNAIKWLSDVVVPAAIQAFQTWGPVILDAFGAIAAIAQDAYQWGYNIGAMFQQGLADTIDGIVNTINWIGSVIADWMEPHSPPKFLPDFNVWGTRTFDTWLEGAEASNVEGSVQKFGRRVHKSLDPRAMGLKERGQAAVNAYFAGWSSDDLTMLGDVQQKVSDALQAMVDVGSLDEKALVPTILGTDEQIKQAIDQLIKTGDVSEETFKRIRVAAGPAGTQVAAYVEATLRSEAANRKLKAAQEELTAVTKRYDDQLKPLQDRLDAMNKTGEQQDRQKQLNRLRGMQQRYQELGMMRQAEAVRQEIDKLSIEDQIARVEAEKKAATDVAQKKVDAAQMAVEAAAKQLEMQQKQIELQKKQNDLIQQQIDLMTGKGDKANKDQLKAQREAEKEKKKQEAEEKKRQREQEQIFRADLDRRLAAANSEQDRLQILQEAQSRYNVGTKEYIDMQKRIEIQQNKVEAETKKNQKATDSLSEAEFEATLKGMDRVHQIDAIKEHLGGLTEGTKDYIKWTGKLNSLEFAQDHQKGPKGTKSKAGKGTLLGGGSLEGFKDMGTTMGEVGDKVNKVGDAINRVRDSIAKFQEKIKPFFDFLNQNGGAVAFVFQKLLVSFLIGLAIEKAAKPLLSFVWGLRQFVTWGNVAWVALTALGYAWKTNFGGIRDITAEVWAAIQKPLTDIKDIIRQVGDAFSKDGLSGALSVLMDKLPQLGGDIANIGITIFNGVKKWVTPFINSLLDVNSGAATWIKNGGLNTLLTAIRGSIESLFTTAGSDGFFSSAAIASGILGLVGGLGMIVQSALGGFVLYLNTEGPKLFKEIIDWIDRQIPVALEYISIGLAALIAGLIEGLIPAMVTIGKRIIDITTWLIPILPDILSSLISGISVLLGWLIGRGVPLLVKGTVDLFTYLYNKLGEMFPKLGFNLGRLIGSTITKLLGALIVGVGALLYQLWQSLQDGSFMEGAKNLGLAFLNAIVGVFKGIVGLILGIFAGLWEPIASIAKQIVQGLGDGITGEWHTLLEAVGKAFDDFVAWIKNFLGISSPSKVFMDIATNIVDGLRQGMEFLHQLWTDVLAWLGQFVTDFLESVLQWETDVLTGIDVFVTRFLTFITDLTLKVVDIMVTFFANLLGKFGVNKDQVLAIIILLRDGLIGAWNYISTEATRIFNEVLTTISTWIANVKNYFTGEGGLVSIIQGAWDTITESITAWGTTIAETFTSAIESAKKALVDGLNDLIDTANDAIDALNAVADMVGIGHINHIPKIAYALGTNYAEGGMALVGENGPEVVNLPRGASVLTNSKTMALFEQAAKDMIAQVATAVQSATNAIERTSGQVAQQLAVAAQQYAATQDAGKQVVVTNNVTTNNERHDHWNLTVNTKAETPSVVSDFATMRAMANV